MSRFLAVPTASAPPPPPAAVRSTARCRTSDVVTALLAALGIVAVLAALSGVRTVDVLTGSMSPGIPRGSLVLTTPLAPADVRVGDVIAFRPPEGFSVGPAGHPVLHRVVAVETIDGVATIATQGDANPARDPWLLARDDAHLAAVRTAVPGLGWIAAGGRLSLAFVLAGCFCLGASSRLLRRA